MEHELDDKANRILSIYTRLKEGRIIYKAKECEAYGVNPRTIQRDIADIQTFLQNQVNENGEIQEIKFDRKQGGYRLETKVEGQLKPRELLAVCKVLLESRSLVKEEMFPILNKLVRTCSEEEDRRLLRDYIRNEMHHYVELRHGKKDSGTDVGSGMCGERTAFDPRSLPKTETQGAGGADAKAGRYYVC